VGRGTLDARVTTIMQRRGGSVWVGTDRAGIFRVSSDHQVTKVETDPAVDMDFIIRLVEDEAGALWIGGNRGLWVLRDRVVQVKASQPLSLASIVVQVPATRGSLCPSLIRCIPDRVRLGHPGGLRIFH
jgi:ligand-binding sensor domain-containing protein